MAKKQSSALTIAILIAIVILVLAAAKAFFGEAQAQAIAEPQIIETESYPKTLCDPSNKLWECRPCQQEYSQPDKRCVCRYCVNESTGKTVEKDNDLRNIYCFAKSGDFVMAEYIDVNEIRKILGEYEIVLASHAYNGNAKDLKFYPLEGIYGIRSLIGGAVKKNKLSQRAENVEDAAKRYNEIEL